MLRRMNIRFASPVATWILIVRKGQVHIRRPLQELLLEIRAVTADLAQEHSLCRRPRLTGLTKFSSVTSGQVRDLPEAASLIADVIAHPRSEASHRRT